MILQTALDFMIQFAAQNERFFGPCKITYTPPLDAAKFPDETHKFGGRKSGGYVISSKQDRIVRYVGISSNVASRIYRHIGKEFSWGRDGRKAHFPNCILAKARPWQDLAEIEMFRNAEWEITGFFPDPVHMAGLLEMAVIHYAKASGSAPLINIVFGDPPRPTVTPAA